MHTISAQPAHLQRQALEVPMANAHDVVSLHTEIFTIMHTNLPPLKFYVILPANDALPAVKVCGSATKSCQTNIEFKLQANHDEDSELIIDCSR